MALKFHVCLEWCLYHDTHESQGTTWGVDSLLSSWGFWELYSSYHLGSKWLGLPSCQLDWILIPPVPTTFCWDFRHVPPHLVYVVLGIKLGTLHSKCAFYCATFSSPSKDAFHSFPKLYMKHILSFLEFLQHTRHHSPFCFLSFPLYFPVLLYLGYW